MQRGYPSSPAGSSDDLPNPLTRNPTLDGLTNFVRVYDHEEWSRTCRVRSLSRHVVAEDHARPRRQGDRSLVPTFADDPTKPELRSDITHIQRCDFTATKPSAGHEGEDRALPEIAVTQERLDRMPGRHGWDPCLATRARQLIHRIADELVAADHPLPEATQCGQAQPNRSGLELAFCEIVLIAPARLLCEVCEQHRPSGPLHEKGLEIPKTPSIGSDRRGGRSFFDPEKVAEFLEQGGQTHRLPPFVRHALGRSIRGDQPRVKRRGWAGRWGRYPLTGGRHIGRQSPRPRPFRSLLLSWHFSVWWDFRAR